MTEPIIAISGALAAVMSICVGTGFVVGGIVGLIAFQPSQDWGFSREHRYALFMIAAGMVQIGVGYIAYMEVVG